MTFTVTITGGKELQKSLLTFANDVKNAKPILRPIGTKLSKFYKENMNSEGIKLTRKKWQALTPKSAKQKARARFVGKKILQRTGKLKKGIKTQRLTNKLVEIGNKVDYYKFHQLGGKKIPKREMVGVNKKVEDIVIKEFNKKLKFK